MGSNCAGSDGFSGLTANPLVGEITDILTAQGGTSVMTEVPEMFGAEQILMDRALDERVFHDIVGLINDSKAYYKKYGIDASKNPTTGNFAGGLSTLEEKSLGCVEKGGKSKVAGVIRFGERLAVPGLNLFEAPGHDLVSITGQVAAGCTLILFTTGRGTPGRVCGAGASSDHEQRHLQPQKKMERLRRGRPVRRKGHANADGGIARPDHQGGQRRSPDEHGSPQVFRDGYLEGRHHDLIIVHGVRKV